MKIRMPGTHTKIIFFYFRRKLTIACWRMTFDGRGVAFEVERLEIQEVAPLLRAASWMFEDLMLKGVLLLSMNLGIVIILLWQYKCLNRKL